MPIAAGADARATHLFRAEPRGHVVKLFDKARPAASVRVAHPASKAAVRFELPGAASDRTAAGATASARVTVNGADVTAEWTVTATGVKEDVILARRPATNTITFAMALEGLTPAPDGQGGYWLYDAGGTVRFRLAPPTAVDAAGKPGDVTLTLTKDSAVLTVDAAFLATAAYPVTVDPTVNWTTYEAYTTLDYDRLSQLTKVEGDPTEAHHGRSDYTYDAARNRLTKQQGFADETRPTLTYAHDRADRLLTASQGGTTVFTYTNNANGNRTAHSGGSVSNTFAYDQANRMTQSVVGGTPSITASYGYDGDGLRIAKTIGAATTRYVWDTAAGLPTLLDDGTRKYVWGANGLAYNVRGSGTAEQVEVYHQDHLGSTRALSVGDGSLSTIYLTDEFGVPNAPEAPSGQSPSTQPFWFTGELLDRDTGTNFVYLRARHYDPGTGRFTSRDPWAGSAAEPMTLNRYAYAANNPTNWTDPSGECPPLPSCLQVAGNVFRAAGSTAVRMREVAQRGLQRAQEYAGRWVGRGQQPSAPTQNVIQSVPSSAALRQSLLNAGMVQPSDTAAHHIVAGEARAAALARQVLVNHRVDINAAENGVFLPTVPEGVGMGASHLSVHSGVYYETVNNLLAQATTRAEVIEILNFIRVQLLTGAFPH